MKKLMTTMLAVAVGVGLHAIGNADTGTSFEGLTGDAPYDIFEIDSAVGNGGELTPLTAGETYWVTNDTATLTVVEGTSLGANKDRPAQYQSKDQYKYLSIKTTLGNPVTRKVNKFAPNAVADPVNIGNGYYFDSLVKFTAFDEDPAINLDGGKLAVWLKENLNANDEPVSTNLVITAGFLDANLQAKAYTTNYVCTVPDVNLNDGAWHRVTVKAIDSIYKAGIAPVPGFVVFVDKKRVVCGDDKGIINKSSLTDNAYVLDSEDALFPSADQNTANKLTIDAVQFDGQGDVDDLVFTSTVPFDEAKDAEFFAINLGENVTGVQGLIAGETMFNISASTSIVWASGQTVQILTNYVTCASGFMFGSVTNQAGTAVAVDDAYTTTAGGSITVTAKPLGAYVGDTPFETLAEAVAYVNTRDAGSGTYTIRLAANASGNVNITNAGITNILDLAGNKFTGTSTADAAIKVTAGALTIKDTVGGGVVQGATDNGALVGAVDYGGGTIAIEGGTYNGNVNATAKSISGGFFLMTHQYEVAGEPEVQEVNTKADLDPMIIDGYEATNNGSTLYWAVTEKVYVAQIEGGASYETLKAAVEAAQAGDTVVVLADCEVDEAITFNYGINLVNNYEVTLSAAYALRLANGTTPVTVSGTGTFLSTGSGSPFLVGNNETTKAGMPDPFAGSMVLSSGTIKRNDAANNMVKVEYGTFTMNGGSLLGGSRGVKADADSGTYTSTVIINAGVISNATAVAASAGATGTSSVTINGADITGPITCSANDATVLIPSTSAARFDRDQTAFCETGYATAQSGDWYVVGPATYTITFVAEGGTVDPASTNYTINSGTIDLPTAAHSGGVGLQFGGWTNETITTAITQFTPSAGNLSNFTLYAKWTAGGPTYPTYLEGADADVKAQYTTWAQTYGADENSVYEDAFLLNVAPGTTGATIDATAISISGTTVTIDINRTVNGVPYVKKAATVAGLATAPKTAIEIVPADQVQDLDNGGRITLENESGTAMFYQIGVQSTPLNQN